MAMGAPLGVVFYHWGGLQALALIIMGVALVAILLAIPRPTVKASKGKPRRFVRCLGASGCTVWRWHWLPPDLAFIATLYHVVL